MEILESKMNRGAARHRIAHSCDGIERWLIGR